MALVVESISPALPSQAASWQELGIYSLRKKKSRQEKTSSFAALSPSRTRLQNTSLGTQPVLA